MNKESKNQSEKVISIIGAGLVGSLLSLYLHKRGYKINVYEKRSDLRKVNIDQGRSINLALSHRGIRALGEIDIAAQVLEHAIPMKGRMIHKESGETNFQAYGEKDQMIYSVSRSRLNKILVEHAERAGVKFLFEHTLTGLSSTSPELKFLALNNQNEETISSDIVIGADGAFSRLRYALEQNEKIKFRTNDLVHGYKELHIPAKDGVHVLEKNALHIWPRGNFMLIALPNMDGSFTCTLFLPLKGENSFQYLADKIIVTDFFKKSFPDAYPLIPDLKESFFSNPTSGLVTVEGFPWISNNNFALIGDAAHAIVPFYGQGMNAGFEDCRILNGLLNKHADNWEKTLEEYQFIRKPNADAIAELALQNFVEMRDLVKDPKFILRKKIETKIHKLHPAYLTLYAMVTFNDMPYAEALELGRKHDELMNSILQINNIEKIWDTEDGWKLVEKYLPF